MIDTPRPRPGLASGGALRRLLLAAILGAGALISGCGGAQPIEGERLARLKGGLAAARPGAVRIAAIGPQALIDGGAGATIVMPYTSYGNKVTEFELYDGYFKVAFVAADELRALGLDARLDPIVWQARSDAIAGTIFSTTERELDLRLTGLQAQEEIQALFRLGVVEKRALYVSRSTLLAARTGLPPEVAAKGKGKTTAREIRDAYFLADGSARPPLSLEVEALELATEAVVATAVDRRTGRARLKFTLRGADGAVVARGEHACEVESEGSGIGVEKGNRYRVTYGGEDPLDRSIRGALRAFWEEALPRLPRRS